MSEAWQSAWVEVLPDFKEFKKTANGQMSTTLGAAGTAGGLTAGRNAGTGLLGGIKGIAGPLVGVIAALGIGKLIGDAVSTGIRYGIGAIDLASDLNESFNAVEVTFGKEVAAELKLLAESAPETLRVTRNTFNEYATRFSSFGQTIVGEGGDVVKFMDELTTRGADFASVYNVEVGDALQLFQSGLAGETEPLRKYGIDLSAASVAAYAYANGIGTAGKELSEAEKIQARYASLLDQTIKVQGDAANTGGDLAAQQRDLAVSFEEAQTKLGQNLLPGFLDLVTFANDHLIPVFSDLLETVGPIFGDALTESAPKIALVVEKLIPLAESFAELMAEEGLPAFLDGMTAFLEDAPRWIDAIQTVDGAIRDATSGILGIGDVVFFLPKVLGWLGQFGVALFTVASNIGTGLGIGLAHAFDTVVEFLINVRRTFDTGVSFLYNSGRALIGGFIDGMLSMTAPLSNAVGGLMDWVAGFFPHSPAERGPFSGAGWAAVAAAGVAVADEFASGFNSRPPINIGASRSGVSLSGVQNGQAALESAFASRGSGVPEVKQYITTQDTDPRLLGRQIGREFQRELAG